MKNDTGNYLHFTRKEKNGIVVLMVIVMLLTIAPYLYARIEAAEKKPAIKFAKEIAMLKRLNADSTERNVFYNNTEEHKRSDRAFAVYPKENISATLFHFDPNTLDISGWQKLGVKEKTATGIRHYIEKGGSFKEASDINKIWGLSETMKARLQPYMIIAEKERLPSFAVHTYSAYEKKQSDRRQLKPFDINSADTSAFIALPGIGSKLAARILLFREKLGGFYAVQQVAETFGLSDSTFQKIKPYLLVSANGIRKMNLNTITLDELKIHPYIRWQLANVIIQYRFQHGNFSSVEDLKKIMIIKEDIYLKISPYCKVE